METVAATAGKSNEQVSREFLNKKCLDITFNLDGTGYTALENIGTGAYGVVCSAVNDRTKDKVAIKKITNIFDDMRVAKRTYREIKILKHFKHDNVIGIRDMLYPTDTGRFNEVFVVLDLMESDLHQIIRSKQSLTDEHVRYFLYQILRGLKYVHSANVIHRDLKPSNLLVNENCDLKIGDFGMARGLSPEPPSVQKLFMTQYVATRWYRAPELMLAFTEYTTAVDVWSVGCIFAEMLGRKPVFPGKDSISQLKLLLYYCGTPSKAFVHSIPSDMVRRFLTGFGREPVRWKDTFPNASKKALDLLSRMLQFEPKNRCTVDEALRHPHLSAYHDADDEPTARAFDFDFERREQDAAQLRAGILAEIGEFARRKEKKEKLMAFFAARGRCDAEVVTTGAPPQERAAAGERRDQVVPMVSSPAVNVSDADVDVSCHSGARATTSLPPGGVSTETSEALTPTTTTGNSGKNVGGVSVVTVTQPAAVAAADDVEMASARSSDGAVPPGQIGIDPGQIGIDPGQIGIDPGQIGIDASSGIDPGSAMSHDGEPDLVILDEPSTEGATAARDGDGERSSLDAKALLKAALLNSALSKKRKGFTEGCASSRPVTALQRQKEREERRRQKKERSKEKKKKELNKQKDGSKKFLTLTEQDQSLLARWSHMQQTTKPFVHPIRHHMKELIEIKKEAVVVAAVPQGAPPAKQDAATAKMRAATSPNAAGGAPCGTTAAPANLVQINAEAEAGAGAVAGAGDAAGPTPRHPPEPRRGTSPPGGAAAGSPRGGGQTVVLPGQMAPLGYELTRTNPPLLPDAGYRPVLSERLAYADATITVRSPITHRAVLATADAADADAGAPRWPHEDASAR
ncbi:PREDICTED: mitogen-activated protein kinase 7-like, partial [Priapulus caudatus]|uniref:Mitogen-activated protein kinase n=1 Tax=Priapulus caudatus TaxID=37621 RepID=A0ABM1EXW0_PRICU